MSRLSHIGRHWRAASDVRRWGMANVCLVIATSLTLTGCIPFPRIAQRSPEVRGHVFDAATGAPVGQAKVVFLDDPKITATADENGDFTIKETKTFELFAPVGMCGPDVFLHDLHPPNVRVTQEGYLPSEIRAYDDRTVDFSRYDPEPANAYMIKGPIFLKPIALRPATR